MGTPQALSKPWLAICKPSVSHALELFVAEFAQQLFNGGCHERAIAGLINGAPCTRLVHELAKQVEG